MTYLRGPLTAFYSLGCWLTEAVHGRDSACKMLVLVMVYDSYHFIAIELHGMAGGDLSGSVVQVWRQRVQSDRTAWDLE